MKAGWDVKELGVVSAISYGYTESASSEPVGPRFLRITDIQNDYVNWDSVPYCKIESADLPKYRLTSGDIVFARTGATTGKSFLVTEPPEAVFASYLIRLRLVDKKLLPEFVSLFLQTSGYWKSIKDGSTGSAQGGFNATKLGALSIPIPPLPEQQRIVGILDEAFDGIAAAKANAGKNLQNARALFESHLQAVFTQRGKGWAETTLRDVCQFENGDRGKNYPNREEYVESGIPWINTGHIQPDGTLSQSEMNFISQEKYASLRSGKIQPGDLVYCLRGATLGKTALVDPFTVGAVASSLVIIRPGNSLDRRYLYYFLTSPLGQGLIKLYDNGAAQPNLGAKSVAKYKISLPSLAEQRAIVSRLTDLDEETQRLESIYRQKLAALDALKKSLLDQAFTGLL
jgi:type I restriction enzyme S subunit